MVNYCKSNVCLNGKTVIITGANTGIGYCTALDLAKRGARVILACRSLDKANEAREKIIKETQSANVIVKKIDLSSLKSVREFAADINGTEDRLDILINNAGAAYLDEQITADGLQLEMETNHFSHFLLTHLLLGLLKKSTPSRIINVSSDAARFLCTFDPNEINKFIGNNNLYCRTKLCNIFFTQILAKKLEGTGITTYSLNPGAVSTEFARFSSVLNFVAKRIFWTAEQGAQTSIYLAVQQGIEDLNGKHFYNCEKVDDYKTARNNDCAVEVWHISEQMVKIKPEEKVEATLAKN